MDNKCIYCGSKKDLTRDHVPPKAFFPSPRPNNLITVPSCKKCNNEFGKDDERIRNLLSSLELTESHTAVKSMIGDKRNRSLLRKEGYTNLQHLYNSMKNVDIFSKSGIYIETKKAFNLDQQVVDNFLERITRALLYYENQVVIYKFDFRWKLSLSDEEFKNLPRDIKHLIGGVTVKYIGDDIFQYAGIYFPNKPSSLWFLRFYNGIEFMVFLKEL